jgi:hypothetical protein
MFNRVRSSAAVGTILAVALVLGSVPASADPATLYSPTPRNGWGHDGTAYAVEIVGDTVYVGGAFANAVRGSQPPKPRANIMALQLSTGTVLEEPQFKAWTNGTVRSIVWDGGQHLYIGGDFTTVNDVPRNRVARLDLAGNLTGFDVNANNVVRDLLVVGNTLYMVGDFTKVKGVTRKRAAAINLVDDSVTGFDPNLSNKTYALAMSPAGRLYVGGNFTTVRGAPRSFLTQVDPMTGDMLGPAFAQLNSLVLDLSVTDSQVFAGVDGGMNSVAEWNPDSGARLWRQQANGDVQAVRYDGGNVYFGFHDGFGGNTTLRVLAADANPGSPLPDGTVEPGFQPVSGGGVGVWGIDSDGQYLVVVGKFPKMGGFNVKGISIHPRP